MTQGAYRILAGDRELIESFVAAPGPGGWRYFGRVREPGSDRELYVVDHVTDLEWRVVRFRLLSPAAELVVERSPNGLHVFGPDDVTEFEGAEIVWSPSPWALHVLRCHLQGRGREVRGVRVGVEDQPEGVTLEFRREAGADNGLVAVNGQTMVVLFDSDLPLRAEGWFDLMGGDAPDQAL